MTEERKKTARKNLYVLVGRSPENDEIISLPFVADSTQDAVSMATRSRDLINPKVIGESLDHRKFANRSYGMQYDIALRGCEPYSIGKAFLHIKLSN